MAVQFKTCMVLGRTKAEVRGSNLQDLDVWLHFMSLYLILPITTAHQFWWCATSSPFLWESVGRFMLMIWLSSYWKLKICFAWCYIPILALTLVSLPT